MIIERWPALQELSPEEKWTLIDELWTSLLAGKEGEQADPVLLKSLEQQMSHYEAHPETATTWERICGSLLAGT